MKSIDITSDLNTKDGSLGLENQKTATKDYQTMEQFLRYIERRAFHFVRASVDNVEDTHDIVQTSMYKLVQKYINKSPADWMPLFYKIMSNKITDFHRRQAVREKIFFQEPVETEEDKDYLQSQVLSGVALESEAPLPSLERERRIDKLIQIIRKLPLRQQQAFMLRSWEGLSTRNTARAMGCSEGSVKTHYSRAMSRLREQLEDHYLE
tara:strand:+ start:445 stop:1071 length:627 start_codon:yes stop_codon:yes gene_type:complete